MRKHKVKSIVLAGELSLLLMLAGFLGFDFFKAVSPTSAKATVGMTPFGGPILSFIPPIPFPPCPAHTIVRNFASGIPMFGIYAAPISQIYSYGNLFTPGNFTLGEYTPIPFVTCPTPYPVFPIYEVGTGAF